MVKSGITQFRRKWNLKKMARMKVKAGVRLLIAEERVGELYSIPLQPATRDVSPRSASKKILKKREDLAVGKLLDLPKISESRRRTSVAPT